MGHGVSSTQDDEESICFIWEQFPLIGMIAEFGNFLGTLDRAVRMLRVDHDVIGVVGNSFFVVAHFAAVVAVIVRSLVMRIPWMNEIRGCDATGLRNE